MIDPSVTILVAVILVFVAYYLHESHTKTKFGNENRKLRNQIEELQKQLADLQASQKRNNNNENLTLGTIIHNHDLDLDRCKPNLTSGGIPPASASSIDDPNDELLYKKIRRWKRQI